MILFWVWLDFRMFVFQKKNDKLIKFLIWYKFLPEPYDLLLKNLISYGCLFHWTLSNFLWPLVYTSHALWSRSHTSTYMHTYAKSSTLEVSIHYIHHIHILYFLPSLPPNKYSISYMPFPSKKLKIKRGVAVQKKILLIQSMGHDVEKKGEKKKRERKRR